MGVGTVNLGDSVFLYTGTSGLMQKTNRLTLHLTFCLFIKNKQINKQTNKQNKQKQNKKQKNKTKQKNLNYHSGQCVK